MLPCIRTINLMRKLVLAPTSNKGIKQKEGLVQPMK